MVLQSKKEVINVEYCPTCHHALPPKGKVKSPIHTVNHQVIINFIVANPNLRKRAIARLYAATVGCSVETANMRIWRVAKKYGLGSVDIQKVDA